MAERNNRPRASVSAEVYGVYNPKQAFVPKVVPKSEDEKASLRSLLLKIFMFKSLEEVDLVVVIDAMEERKFSNGDSVIAQGDDGSELYVNYEGTLDCSKIFPDQTESTFLKKYVPGEVFGELCLLYNAPRAASIVATSDCVLFSLDRETFNHIVKDSAVQNREKYEQFLSKIEVLQDLDRYERNKLCDCLQVQNFETGAYIINQGERGDTFYMIMKGSGEATKKNRDTGLEEVVFEYAENMYFGELSLLRDEPRAASIRTTVRLIRHP